MHGSLGNIVGKLPYFFCDFSLFPKVYINIYEYENLTISMLVHWGIGLCSSIDVVPSLLL